MKTKRRSKRTRARRRKTTDGEGRGRAVLYNYVNHDGSDGIGTSVINTI